PRLVGQCAVRIEAAENDYLLADGIISRRKRSAGWKSCGGLDRIPRKGLCAGNGCEGDGDERKQRQNGCCAQEVGPKILDHSFILLCENVEYSSHSDSRQSFVKFSLNIL